MLEAIDMDVLEHLGTIDENMEIIFKDLKL